MAVIDDNLARSITEAFRLSQLDLQNQDIFFGGSGVVTITRADGSTIQISSPQKLMADVAKAMPITGASNLTGRFRFNAGPTGAGITYDSVPFAGYVGVHQYWNTAPIAFNADVINDGSFAPCLNHRYFYGGVSAGTFYTGMYIARGGQFYQIGHTAEDGTHTASWQFNRAGNAYANSGSWVSASDERIKENITRIEDPLAKMRVLKGCTWVRKDTGSFGIGFIAQDVEQVFPDAVTISGMPLIMTDGSEIKDVRCPDTSGVAAALHHEAILALMDEKEALNTKMESMSSELESLKLVVAQLSEQVKAKNQ